jgi:hypothetical protein
MKRSRLGRKGIKPCSVRLKAVHKFGYHGYDIKLRPIKGGFDWEVAGKSGFTGKQSYFGGGYVFGTKGEATKIAKAYVDEKLQKW